MSADHLVNLIALVLVIFSIVLAVAVVLAVAKLAVAVLRALMRRRAAMLMIWATASLLVIVGLGAAVDDAVRVSNLSTNGVGIQD
jgi:hypothetical protein